MIVSHLERGSSFEIGLQGQGGGRILEVDGQGGWGVYISLRGNIPLGGNNLFAACYRNVGRKKSAI